MATHRVELDVALLENPPELGLKHRRNDLGIKKSCIVTAVCASPAKRCSAPACQQFEVEWQQGAEVEDGSGLDHFCWSPSRTARSARTCRPIREPMTATSTGSTAGTTGEQVPREIKRAYCQIGDRYAAVEDSNAGRLFLALYETTRPDVMDSVQAHVERRNAQPSTEFLGGMTILGDCYLMLGPRGWAAGRGRR
jgi:hypothetical protein